MKKFTLFFSLVFLIFNIYTFSQCTWFPTSTIATVTSDYSAISFPSQWSRVLVGSNGVIVKTENEGYYWYQATSNTNVNLHCVNFPTDSIGYAGGDNGTILKSTDMGYTWTVLSNTGTNHEYGIYFISSSVGFVVGQSGSISKTDDAGTTWNTQTFGNSNFNSVYFVNQTTGWAVGDAGSIYKTSDAGSNWVSQTGVNTGNNYAVNFLDSVTGFIVGQNGSIQKTMDGGVTWVDQVSNSSYDLYSVAIHDAYSIYAVGANGTILETNDGGTTWFANTNSLNTNLNSIVIKYNTKYIAGTNSTLLQYFPDVVSSQPVDQNVCLGNNYFYMTIAFATPLVQYTGQWQMDSGTGWTDITVNDTSHYYATNSSMTITNYNLSFDNRKYRFIYNTVCGTDTSNVATLHIRIPETGSIFNLLPSYCSDNTQYPLEGSPAQGYFSGPGISNNSFNPSLAFSDSVTIYYYFTDSTGCQSQVSAQTHIYPLPVLQQDSVFLPTCGVADGFVFMSAYNGSAPYTYNWSNGSTNYVLSDVPAGIYYLTVTDSRGCKNFDYKMVSNISGAVFEVTANPASCSNVCDGSVTASVFQGIPPYTYLWSSGGTGATDSSLCKGHYLVTITDANNCKVFSEINVGYMLEAGSINGYTYCQGGPILGNVVVHLFKDSSGGFAEETNVLITYGYEGMYTISNIAEGNYYLQVEPDHELNPSILTSFYKMNGSTYLWDSATVVSVTCGSNIYASVQMVTRFNNGSGTGTISGYIHQPTGGFGKNGKKIYPSLNAKLVGEPVPGAEVFVELEPDDEPIANTQTDTTGFYEVSGLSDGLYSINVQIPGVPMDSTYFINVSGSDTVFTNINFFVDTSGQAMIDSLQYSVGEIGKDIASISLYPNPFNESFTFEYEITGESDVKIEIFDLSGRNLTTLVNARIPKGKHVVRLNSKQLEIAEGAYFVRCKVNNSYFIKKLIKCN